MKPLPRVILPAVAAAVASCASTSAEHVDRRTMIISGHSGPLGSGSEVMRKMVISAAEEAQRRGYSHFVFHAPEPDAHDGQVLVRFLTFDEAAEDEGEVWSVAEVLEAVRSL